MQFQTRSRIPDNYSFPVITEFDNQLNVLIHRHDAFAFNTQAYSFGTPLILPYQHRLLIGSKTQVLIRAKDIALATHYIEGISIQNQIKGKVCALIFHEYSVYVQVDYGGILLAEITHGACRNMKLVEGQTIYCLFKTQSVHYLDQSYTNAG